MKQPRNALGDTPRHWQGGPLTLVGATEGDHVAGDRAGPAQPDPVAIDLKVALDQWRAAHDPRQLRRRLLGLLTILDSDEPRCEPRCSGEGE